MSCGLNESIFIEAGVDYWYDYCLNGAVIYCDHPVTICEAPFPADADIGGWGVAVAFIVTAWITIVLAILNAINPTLDTIDKFRNWLDPQKHSTNQGNTNGQPRKRRLDKFADLSLLSLCDLQLLTGTAIIVAGLTQWHTITFYHPLLVISYCFLTLNSFWAARASSYRTIVDDAKSKWVAFRSRVRDICTITTLVLATVFVSYQIYGDWWYWDRCGSGNCYRISDKSIPQSQWLWVAGLITYVLTLSAQLTGPGRKWANLVSGLVIKWCEWLGRRCIKQLREVGALRPEPLRSSAPEVRLDPIHKVISSLWLCIWGLSLVSLWCFVQFWAIWSAGKGIQAVALAFYIAFAAWNTWNIVNLKELNRPLLEGSESSWGFGQVLPIFLLVMIVFSLFDAARETFEERPKSTSASNSATDP